MSLQKKLKIALHLLKTPILAITERKLIKIWLDRAAGKDIVDMENKMYAYWPKGTIFINNINGQAAYVKLLSYLPFIEKEERYDEPIKGQWQFIRYLHDKDLSEMTFQEYCQFVRKVRNTQ